MNRLVWSIGFGGLVLACALALWLRRPLERAPLLEPEPLAARVVQPPLPPALPAEPTPRPRRQAVTTPQTPPKALPTEEPARERPTRSRRTPPLQRLRLANALRGAHPSPDARREAVLAELTASGESQAPWTDLARAALGQWRAQVEADVLPVTAEPARCFEAGCVARITFPDADSFQESFRRTPDLRLGEDTAHMQLPPERLASGEVVASWLVLPPAAP
ncbi:hypothetical protein [Myxococcus sp. Y35]|uniref:hypothetical protein n=1 Tax=Pseudomyxococcus flavus TaxID=3115648 RepID=UPI003CE7D8A2